MKTNNLGYPRIGTNRELKKACEKYWSGKSSLQDLKEVGKNIRQRNWLLQKIVGIDLIPSNDFSFYDQILDMSLTVNAIPHRYHELAELQEYSELDLYFAMARGYQKNGLDITAMEMTKWFDTNYHYIVPEFYKDQSFSLFSKKIIDEFEEAKSLGITTKPVLIGPVSYLLLGKSKEENFDPLDLLPGLLPVYKEVLRELTEAQVEWLQIDEPFLALDLNDKAKEGLKEVYKQIKNEFPTLKVILTTYFGGLRQNLDLAVTLPVAALHIDLIRCPAQLNNVLAQIPGGMQLSLGVVDGRNVWINDLQESLAMVLKAVEELGTERVLLAPSCSLLHAPCDVSSETNSNILNPEIKEWLAFAKQKLEELVTLKQLTAGEDKLQAAEKLGRNIQACKARKLSALIHHKEVKQRLKNITATDTRRAHEFITRKSIQCKALNLPLFPTTTIGSFPQTKEVRSWRAQYKKGEITLAEYDKLIRSEIEKAIRLQEESGLDVLVHGEFERNDMVEYFGEQLAGFAFTQNGWVQSYGSRCVKPPVIYGDVYRPAPMTVKWSAYAQSLTKNIVKGMLTGPVTMLEWSFVRNDQPRSETCKQIALAIRDEVNDLEKAGLKVIQIDEPAFREGLPLRKEDWKGYLQWAIEAFKLASGGVKDETQIHTHMCYSEFNDIIESIAALDADVITIECSRSQMELLDAFAQFKYPNEIGPGVYDIHSPRIPAKSEIMTLLQKAEAVIPREQLWVNPDCGLKTRRWEETEKALVEMVSAARDLRER